MKLEQKIVNGLLFFVLMMRKFLMRLFEWEAYLNNNVTLHFFICKFKMILNKRPLNQLYSRPGFTRDTCESRYSISIKS